MEKTKLEQFKEDLLDKIYDGTIKNVYVDTDIKDYRQDDSWFGGTVISFDYKNLNARLSINGEVRADITYQYWDKETKQSMIKTEQVVDKNESGKLSRVLKEEYNIFSDNEITTDFAEFVNCGKMKDDGTKEYSKKIYLELHDNNWCELELVDNRTDEAIDCGDNFTCTLSEIIEKPVDELLEIIKKYAEDNFDESYEAKGSDILFVKECEYEKYVKTFCDYLNLKPETLEKALYKDNATEQPLSFKEWSKEYEDKRSENYLIDGMFKSKGVSEVFKEDGTFTEEALKVYDEVSDEFFDGITDNLDKLCHEYDCFPEDLEQNDYEPPDPDDYDW